MPLFTSSRTSSSFDNSRITRNDKLYDSPLNLCKRGADVKKYVKSVFGAESPQFAQVSGLQFTKPR